MTTEGSAPTVKGGISAAALALILAVGALLRFSHADWDGGYQLHPDERAILFIAQTLELPGSLGKALSPAHSPLNPYRSPGGERRLYAYGHLPLYLSAATNHALSLVCRATPEQCARLAPDSFLGRLAGAGEPPGSAAARFAGLTYTGRALSALADTLTILATALLARRLYGPWAGLLAATFAAFAVLHLQNARFGTVDAPLALLCTLTLWLAVRFATTRLPRDSLLAGVCAGLALSCKASAALLAIPLVAAHLSLMPRPARLRQRVRLDAPRAFWLTLLAGALAFVATSPYVVLDPLPFFSETLTQTQMASGWLDWPFTRQYAGTPPLWPFIEQQARWTLGLPLAAATYAGLAWATRQALRSARRPLIVVLAWAWAYLLVVGMQQVKFPRYMLPLTPTLFALAAGMLSLGLARHAQIIRLTAAIAVLFPTALYALAFTNMYRQSHPWLAATDWLYQSLPAGSALAVEYWDDPLPLDTVAADGTGFRREQVYDTRLLDPFAEPDDRAKLSALLADVAEADAVILSSNRLYGVIPRLETRYPLTSAYYRALFAGELGFNLEAAFARYPTLPDFPLYDDPFQRPGLPPPSGALPARGLNLGPADESFTVYDHPLVLIFRNAERLTAAEMEEAVLAQVTTVR